MSTDLPVEVRHRTAMAKHREEAIEALRDEVAAGVPGYLDGQRNLLIKMGEMMPAIADRLLEFMTAPLEEHVDAKGKITRMVRLDADLSPGQVKLMDTLVNRVLPQLQRMPKQKSDDDPMKQGNVFSVTVNTVGPALPSEGKLTDGQARPVSTVVINAPTTPPDQETDDEDHWEDAAAAAVEVAGTEVDQGQGEDAPGSDAEAVPGEPAGDADPDGPPRADV